MNIGSMTGPSKTGAQPKSIHMGGNKKLAIRQYRPGKWQVYFSHEGKQIHLQKDEKGYPLNSEGAATKLMLHISEHGYDPRLFGCTGYLFMS